MRAFNPLSFSVAPSASSATSRSATASRSARVASSSPTSTRTQSASACPRRSSGSSRRGAGRRGTRAPRRRWSSRRPSSSCTTRIGLRFNHAKNTVLHFAAGRGWRRSIFQYLPCHDHEQRRPTPHLRQAERCVSALVRAFARPSPHPHPPPPPPPPHLLRPPAARHPLFLPLRYTVGDNCVLEKHERQVVTSRPPQGVAGGEGRRVHVPGGEVGGDELVGVRYSQILSCVCGLGRTVKIGERRPPPPLAALTHL